MERNVERCSECGRIIAPRESRYVMRRHGVSDGGVVLCNICTRRRLTASGRGDLLMEVAPGRAK